MLRTIVLAALLLLAACDTLERAGAPPAERGASAPTGTSHGLDALPIVDDAKLARFDGDWLVEHPRTPCLAYRRAGGRELVLENGLARRVFRLVPLEGEPRRFGVATSELRQLASGESFVRAVEPEAVLKLYGQTLRVGGLLGQKNRAFLRPEDLEALTADPEALALVDVETGPIPERLPWKRVRHAADLPWPPPGLRLTFVFAPAAGRADEGLRVQVHYDVYQGMPLFAKTVVVDATGTGNTSRLLGLECERLAVVEPQSSVEKPHGWLASNLHVETAMGMFGQDRYTGEGSVRWLVDPAFTTQVNYSLETPCLLVCGPPIGPGVTLGAQNPAEPLRESTLEAPAVFELLCDSHERERRGLELRRMYRTLAPWCTENPILMHARSADPVAVRIAIDQCADAGFEMLILSFGSGVDLENTDPAYRAQLKELVDYARSRNVELGAYSLLASRAISPEDDVIDLKTGQRGHAIFGNSPCLESKWGRAYLRQIGDMLAATGMSVLEHDGSYPGDVCASTLHPGHADLADSQWRQWRAITSFYEGCRAHGIYLNVPDWYFLTGSSKTGMGYRETNWSLPREEQLLHARQNIFDGTFEKTPSMGWMFVPLTEYQGGGAAATLEPLKEHLDAYEAHLANDFGAGVQACWRGPRLYDTAETRALVRKWVRFYKQHRRILDSDLVHLRRADGRDWDGWLHVDPDGEERALAMLYNPLATPIRRSLEIPLYYAGLERRARVCVEEGAPREIELDAEQRAHLEVEIPARGRTWIVFRAR